MTRSRPASSVSEWPLSGHAIAESRAETEVRPTEPDPRQALLHDKAPPSPDDLGGSMSDDPKSKLNGPQLIALGHVAFGRSQRKAADAAGVSLSTVSRWCTKNSYFRAAVAQIHAELLAEQANMIRSIDYDALALVHGHIRQRSEESVKTALSWLRIRGACSCGTSGSTAEVHTSYLSTVHEIDPQSDEED